MDYRYKKTFRYVNIHMKYMKAAMLSYQPIYFQTGNSPDANKSNNIIQIRLSVLQREHKREKKKTAV